MLAVQECYISVCKEKDMLEERKSNRETEEASIRENEVYKFLKFVLLFMKIVLSFIEQTQMASFLLFSVHFKEVVR